MSLMNYVCLVFVLTIPTVVLALRCFSFHSNTPDVIRDLKRFELLQHSVPLSVSPSNARNAIGTTSDWCRHSADRRSYKRLNTAIPAERGNIIKNNAGSGGSRLDEDVDMDHSLERIRYRGRVAYDGTGFRGWQIQSVGRTCQVSLCCFF